MFSAYFLYEAFCKRTKHSKSSWNRNQGTNYSAARITKYESLFIYLYSYHVLKLLIWSFRSSFSPLKIVVYDCLLPFIVVIKGFLFYFLLQHYPEMSEVSHPCELNAHTYIRACRHTHTHTHTLMQDVSEKEQDLVFSVLLELSCGKIKKWQFALTCSIISVQGVTAISLIYTHCTFFFSPVVANSSAISSNQVMAINQRTYPTFPVYRASCSSLPRGISPC